jgi:hypothetical protein
MKNAVLVLALVLLSATSDAFMLGTSPSRTITSTRAFVQSSNLKSVRLYDKEDANDDLKSVRLYDKEDANDDEVERLKTMAAKFRTEAAALEAEAAALEAERAQELVDVAERAFQKFDTDQDGEISLTELKAGLEKSFKVELTEVRVQELLTEVDKNGDGKLQLEEFVDFIKLLLA